MQSERDAATWKRRAAGGLWILSSAAQRWNQVWLAGIPPAHPPARVRGHGPGSAARRRRLLAALARLDLHVGELLNFRCLANVVEDGERLQVLGDTARRR